MLFLFSDKTKEKELEYFEIEKAKIFYFILINLS